MSWHRHVVSSGIVVRDVFRFAWHPLFFLRGPFRRPTPRATCRKGIVTFPFVSERHVVLTPSITSCRCAPPSYSYAFLGIVGEKGKGVGVGDVPFGGKESTRGWGSIPMPFEGRSFE